MNQIEHAYVSRPAAVKAFAVVGFITLIVLGIWLAIASTRLVPALTHRVGVAAVALGTRLAPEETPEGAGDVITIGNKPTQTTNIGSIVTTPSHVAATAGTEQNTTVSLGAAPVAGTAALHGLPDLEITVRGVGYMTGIEASTFVAADTVPAGYRPAISFIVKNIGTNVSGKWRFSAYVPATTSYLYQSVTQQSLNPGDSIDYTLSFDRPIAGADKIISVTVDPDHLVAESGESNNSIIKKITILAS